MGEEGASACHEKDPEEGHKEGRQEKKWRQVGWNPHPSFMIPTGEEINTDALLPR